MFVSTWMISWPESSRKTPGRKNFTRPVHEVIESLAPYILENPVLAKMKVLERIAEPERVVMFRVPWLNDKGEDPRSTAVTAYR